MGFYSEENCQTEAHEPLLDWASGRKAPVVSPQGFIQENNVTWRHSPQFLVGLYMIISISSLYVLKQNNTIITMLHFLFYSYSCVKHTKYMKKS